MRRITDIDYLAFVYEAVFRVFGEPAAMGNIYQPSTKPEIEPPLLLLPEFELVPRSSNFVFLRVRSSPAEHVTRLPSMEPTPSRCWALMGAQLRVPHGGVSAAHVEAQDDHTVLMELFV